MSSIFRDGCRLPPASTHQEAVKKLYAHGDCYLGVVDDVGALKGWLNLCCLFKEREDWLGHQMDSIVSYLAADGPGGSRGAPCHVLLSATREKQSS
jgi:hypothetical protein